MASQHRAQRSERFQQLVDAGWEAFHDRRPRWLRAVLARMRGLEPEAPEVLDLQWRLAYVQGDMDRALEVAQQGAALYPDDPDLLYATGWCLLELGAFEDAVPPLARACEREPTLADGWYDLAVAHEALGNPEATRVAFSRVHELDVSRLSAEPRLFTIEEFEAIVASALAEVPGDVQAAMTNLAVIVEDYPDPWIVEQPPYDPRLFGLFVGPTFADTRSTNVATDEPTRIYLFQRNLERQFRHPDWLRDEIRITLIHEVGHFLGLSEADLAERGWL
ncbi:MAG: metallopeptidase family protein [Myxococcota bacterium]|jgi:predicted Zn-dependent protease with MMP-like domain|nr:metallopeptidase family protein [Myxococcota bacterium]